MNLQDLDPKDSPHLGERWIGGNVDLDLLSLFPLIGGKNHGGIERNPSSRRSTMGGFFVLKSYIHLGKKGGFIGESAMCQLFHKSWSLNYT